MPFYEYQCTSCGFEVEELQKIGEKPLKKCEQCGKATMKKMVSAAAFRLKGSGWYETDFKSGSKKNVADSGSEKKTTETKSSESKASTAKPSDKKGGGSATTKKASIAKK